MKLRFHPVTRPGQRDAIFHRMREEGLLGCAMYALSNPSLSDWRRICATPGSLLLGCSNEAGRLLGCGLFSPWRGDLLEFDFTTFRASARLAVPMARGAFDWIFSRLDCSGIVGICPAPNRHAWRLAEACGFRFLGRLPAACFHARKGRMLDGLLFLHPREVHVVPLQ